MKYDRCVFILTMFFVVGLFSACSNRAAENKEVIRRWYENVWNKGELELVDEIVAPPAQVSIDIGAIKQGIQARRAAFPDMRFFIKDTIVERNKVVTRWVAHGTHQGTLAGIPPTGRQISVFGISIGVVQSGKIVGLWESWDALGALAQIGAVPEQLNISRGPSPEKPAVQ